MLNGVVKHLRREAAREAQSSPDNLFQSLAVREINVIEDAATQESVGEVLFRVAGEDNYRAITLVGCERAPCLSDRERHVLDFVEHVVRQIAWSFINFVNENDGAHRSPATQMFRQERVCLSRLHRKKYGQPQGFIRNVIFDRSFLFAKLRVMKMAERVVTIKKITRGRGRLRVKD